MCPDISACLGSAKRYFCVFSFCVPIIPFWSNFSLLQIWQLVLCGSHSLNGVSLMVVFRFIELVINNSIYSGWRALLSMLILMEKWLSILSVYFFLPYHVATASTQFCQIFLMNTVVFFVLINCATILETHIQWREVCITKMLIATEKKM